MSHTNLVMACQWGWTRDLDPNATAAQMPFLPSSAALPIPTSTLHNVRTKRFAPCQGRLYHQLLCSHRIRTDLVEDCGANCVEPLLGNPIGVAFICHECVQAEATAIWEAREAQHKAAYPPMDQMTNEQYEQYYEEHRQLEAQFACDHKMYEAELKAKTRPSNICSAIEASDEDMGFAAELDSLSLSLLASNTPANDLNQLHSQARGRRSLPNDASELLHWNLSTLDLERGSCGIEYATSRPNNGAPTTRQLDTEELWRRSRGRD